MDVGSSNKLEAQAFNRGKVYMKSMPRIAVNLSLYLNRRVNNVKEKVNNDLILNTMENSQISSINDWINVRKAILEHEYNRGQYSKHNIDAMILGYCVNNKKYDLGSSYLDFLSQENIRPNLATLGRYLKLLYTKNQEICLESAETVLQK
ncbi:hypothetical protein NQ314_017955 [Rhamnusium bicolor]|uniref:Uncharacterized protein n=1 Tax=Rhamnusium bicolor TaxID=1586634 RepID=A0AAV8WSG3_9CUCU|nr:hypothetical protein NQ314_017955 [Rhamnusium bicolor]